MSKTSIITVDGGAVHQLDKALHESYERQDEMRIEIANLKRVNRRLAITLQELRSDWDRRNQRNGGR